MGYDLIKSVPRIPCVGPERHYSRASLVMLGLLMITLGGCRSWHPAGWSRVTRGDGELMSDEAIKAAGWSSILYIPDYTCIPRSGSFYFDHHISIDPWGNMHLLLTGISDVDADRYVKLSQVVVYGAEDRAWSMLTGTERIYPLQLWPLDRALDTQEILVAGDPSEEIAEALRISEEEPVLTDPTDLNSEVILRLMVKYFEKPPLDLPLVNGMRARVVIAGAVGTAEGERSFELTYSFVCVGKERTADGDA